MIEQTNVTLESGKLPADWTVERGPEGFDGKAMKSGRSTRFSMNLALPSAILSWQNPMSLASR